MDRRKACLGLALGAAALPANAQDKPRARHRRINPFEPSYDNAHEVSGATRWLFVSGQIPADALGKVPADFKDQARLTWRNVEQQLKDADMTMEDLVKVTIFLSDRKYIPDNGLVRREMKLRLPAMTIIIATIYREDWLLEIEAIAAA